MRLLGMRKVHHERQVNLLGAYAVCGMPLAALRAIGHMPPQLPLEKIILDEYSRFTRDLKAGLVAMCADIREYRAPRGEYLQIDSLITDAIRDSSRHDNVTNMMGRAANARHMAAGVVASDVTIVHLLDELHGSRETPDPYNVKSWAHSTNLIVLRNFVDVAAGGGGGSSGYPAITSGRALRRVNRVHKAALRAAREAFRDARSVMDQLHKASRDLATSGKPLLALLDAFPAETFYLGLELAAKYGIETTLVAADVTAERGLVSAHEGARFMGLPAGKRIKVNPWQPDHHRRIDLKNAVRRVMTSLREDGWIVPGKPLTRAQQVEITSQLGMRFGDSDADEVVEIAKELQSGVKPNPSRKPTSRKRVKRIQTKRYGVYMRSQDVYPEAEFDEYDDAADYEIILNRHKRDIYGIYDSSADAFVGGTADD